MLAPISSASVCAPTQASLKRQPSRSSVRSHSSALRLKIFIQYDLLSLGHPWGTAIGIRFRRFAPRNQDHDAAMLALLQGTFRHAGPNTSTGRPVLSGVYKLSHLESAQASGLTIFWAHDLDALADWIEQTRT